MTSKQFLILLAPVIMEKSLLLKGVMNEIYFALPPAYVQVKIIMQSLTFHVSAIRYCYSLDWHAITSCSRGIYNLYLQSQKLITIS